MKGEPELRICETNPYWDAPNSSAEGIYEAGKQAQLEADKKVVALIPDTEAFERNGELREKIAFILKPLIKSYVLSYIHNLNQLGTAIKRVEGCYLDQIVALFPNIEEAKKQVGIRMLEIIDNPYVVNTIRELRLYGQALGEK